MKKFKTYNQIMNDWTETISISAPPFSKVVGADIIDNALSIVVEIDSLYEYEADKKTFMFLIKKESEFEFMPPIGYEYLKTCFSDNISLSTTSSGYGPNANISLSAINDKKIYRIFICETKALAETRDIKIDTILETT